MVGFAGENLVAFSTALASDSSPPLDVQVDQVQVRLKCLGVQFARSLERFYRPLDITVEIQQVADFIFVSVRFLQLPKRVGRPKWRLQSGD